MKLDTDDSERILRAVRTLTPKGVTVRRRGSGNLIVKYQIVRFNVHRASAPVFGHISGRNSNGGALAIAYQRTLRIINDVLVDEGSSWPGLVPGPVDVSTDIHPDVVVATITDREGNILTFPAIQKNTGTERNPEIDPGPQLSPPETQQPSPEPAEPKASHGPALPDELAERILNAVCSAMPTDFTADRHGRIVHLRSGGNVLDSDQQMRPASWPQMFGPRNRDGVSQRSVGWATWMLLDGVIRMSRSRGAPIDKATARRLHAYTQIRDGHLHSWLAEPGDGVPTVTFPALDLTDLTPEPPSGPKLPVPLLRRYRLPELGEIMTDPANK